MSHPISTTTFVRLIFLKDVRRVRWLLLLMLGLAGVLVLSSQPGDSRDAVPAAILLRILCLGVIILTVLNDPAGRDFRFLFTRPVPGSAILTAKALFFTVFLVIPACVIHELIVAPFGVPLLPLDHLLMFIETAIFAAYEISIVALLCILFRGMNRRDGATVAVLGGIAFSINSFLLTPQRYVVQGWGDESKVWLIDFSDLLFKFLIIATVLITAIIRYRTKRFYLPLGVAASGWALGSLVLWLPMIDASNLYLKFKVTDPLTAEQWSHIRFDPPFLIKFSDGRNFYDSSFRYKTFQATLTPEGLPASYFAFPTRCQTVATLRSGKRVPFDTETSYRIIDAGGTPGWWRIRASLGDTSVPQAQMALVTGILPKYSDPQLGVSLFSYGPKSLQGEDLTGVRLKGSITVRIYRAYLAGSVPLRSGQTLLTPRRRYTLADANFSRDNVQFGFESLQAPLILRGESSKFILLDMNQNILVVYRPFNEALQEAGGCSSSSVNNDVVKEIRFKDAFKSEFWRDPNWKPLPPDWASGAELDFIGSEPCGQITIPYEIDNVDLEP